MRWGANPCICLGVSHVQCMAECSMSSVWKSVLMKNVPQTISGLPLHLIFHRFSPFNCCLSAVLWLDKGDYPENSHVVFCPNK